MRPRRTLPGLLRNGRETVPDLRTGVPAARMLPDKPRLPGARLRWMAGDVVGAAERRPTSPWDSQLGREWRPPKQLIDLPHPLRMWDYMIGGKDNYQTDRDAVDAVLPLVPDVLLVARAAEAFMSRAVRLVAAPEHGLRQFLHVGAFIPTQHSFDALARAGSPGARFAYVTDDAVSAAHARGVLAAQARGTGEVHALWADFRDLAPVLAGSWLRERLDLAEPAGVLLFGMPDFVADEDRLADSLTALRAALAPGSLIAVSHVLSHPDPGAAEKALRYLVGNPFQYTPRPLARVRRLLSDFAFAEPGLTLCTSWRPDGEGPGDDLAQRCHVAGGVARVG